MGADLMSMAVAAIGVIGTLGATVAAQRAALNGKRLDAEVQRRQQEQEQAEATRQAELEAKRAVYSALNAAARNYRMLMHDTVTGLGRNGIADPVGLETARAHYREMYAEAQMLVSDRVLDIASEVDLCLGNSYRALGQVMVDGDPTGASRELHRWLDGPASEAVWLLRRVLREDIGVVDSSPDLESRLDQLRVSRAAVFADRAGVEGCNLTGDAGLRRAGMTGNPVGS